MVQNIKFSCENKVFFYTLIPKRSSFKFPIYSLMLFFINPVLNFHELCLILVNL